MGDSELMPCPFCKQAAYLHENDWCEPSEYGVHCSNVKKCGASTGSFQNKVNAIRAWNLRSPVAEGGGWLPIESAPKDGTPILAGWPWDGHREIVRWEIQGGWRGDVSGFWKAADEPKHWQPLPSPPAPSQEGASDTGEQVRSER